MCEWAAILASRVPVEVEAMGFILLSGAGTGARAAELIEG
jgi:hypothetical protein